MGYKKEELETSLRAHLTELFSNRMKYDELSHDPESKENWTFFKGKSEAYGYAHSKLLNILQWYNIDL